MGEAATKPVGKAVDRLGAANRFFTTGLFENVYPLSMEWAAKNHVVPVLKATHPEWTSREIAAQAAKDINVLYSNLGVWQSVFAQPAMRELTRNLFFSTNETESWIRSAVSTVHGPSKRLWMEHWAGLGIFLAGLASVIHFATTRKPLPVDRFNPVVKDDRGLLPINYNPKFLAPDIPIKDANGDNLTVDLVGQADTIFRFALDPLAALQARENVLLRAITTQATGKPFGGGRLEGAKERGIQAAYELAAPIGLGAVLQAVRQKVPAAEDIIPPSERRIGAAGQAIQATGINLRSVRRDVELLNQYNELKEKLLPATLKDAWEKYQDIPGRDRAAYLKSAQGRGRASSIRLFERRLDRERRRFRRQNPLLDSYMVEIGRVSEPVTQEGRNALRLRRRNLGISVGNPAPSPRFSP